VGLFASFWGGPGFGLIAGIAVHNLAVERYRRDATARSAIAVGSVADDLAGAAVRPAARSDVDAAAPTAPAAPAGAQTPL
jgi:hypothetical protein